MIVYKFVGMEIIWQGCPTKAMNIGHSRTMIPQYLMYIHIPYWTLHTFPTILLWYTFMNTKNTSKALWLFRLNGKAVGFLWVFFICVSSNWHKFWNLNFIITDEATCIDNSTSHFDKYQVKKVTYIHHLNQLENKIKHCAEYYSLKNTMLILCPTFLNVDFPIPVPRYI